VKWTLLNQQADQSLVLHLTQVVMHVKFAVFVVVEVVVVVVVVSVCV